MKRRYEAFSLNGSNDKAVKTFRNEPEAIEFAKTHDDVYVTRRDSDGYTYVWNERRERWEK